MARRRKRWDRNRYPDNWEEISQQFRASRNFTCEHCGTARGTFRISKAWNLYQSKVMAAHRYPNDTRNPNPELLCLCERCHFPYDGQFREIIEEGEHQVVMHDILLDGQWEPEEVEGEGEPPALDVPYVHVNTALVCCSCGARDAVLEFGCGNCGRPVHYQEPECGGWLLDSWHEEAAAENEFWCLECLANGLL